MQVLGVEQCLGCIKVNADAGVAVVGLHEHRGPNHRFSFVVLETLRLPCPNECISTVTCTMLVARLVVWLYDSAWLACTTFDSSFCCTEEGQRRHICPFLLACSTGTFRKSLIAACS